MILVCFELLLSANYCDSIVFAGQGRWNKSGLHSMNEKFFDLKSEKQDRMINASLKIFAKNGYKHASTDDIVKEAGISKGLLFHYFGSKAGLYSFLADYSVKYMSFELQRTIGDETDYFEYLDKLESAKLTVLRNYPYMNEFIESILVEGRDNLDESGIEALSTYCDTLEKYRDKLTMPKVKAGVDMGLLEEMINYTIKGLNTAYMESDSFKPEELHTQISEYIRVYKALASK